MSDTMSTNSDWEYLQREDCIYPWCRKITDGIKKEVNEVKTSKMWPFSAYGPFDLKPSLPNYIEDLSFEELRLKYYQAKKENTMEQYENEITQLIKKKNNKTTELIALTQNVIDNLFKIYQTPIYTTCCGLKYINKIGGRIEKSIDNQDKWKKIDKFIMDLILVDMLPYNLVEGSLFQHIQFAGDKSYKVKSKDFYRFSLMPETLNKVKAKVMLKLELAKFVSITIHICYSPDNSCSLLVFMAHFLDGNYRTFVILYAGILEEDYKESNITDKLHESIANFNLVNKIHLYVYKNLNITKEVLRNCETLECIAHLLQLTIEETIFKNQNIQEIITKSQLMHQQIYDNNSKASQDQKQVKTKWINSYLKIKDLVKRNSEDDLNTNKKCDINTLTPEEWLLLNDLLNILELYYEIYTDLTEKTATISLIIPLINILKTKLNELNCKEDLKDVMIQELNTRFKFIENSTYLITATFLDPRFKNKYLNETQINIAQNEIITFLNDNEFKTDLDKTDNSTKNGITEELQMLEIAIEDRDDIAMQSNDHDDNAIENELSLYTEEPLEHRKFNINEYWLRSNYKNLRECSLMYLTAPPTAGAYEEFINAGCKLYNERCAVLKEFNTDELLFCHYNIQIFRCDY